MSSGDDIRVLPDIIPDIKFNLEAQEQFALDKGIIFEHYAAIPSTIGQIDRGDLRRPDTLDTLSENGFIYRKVGEFVGTILGNSKKHDHGEGGILDTSTARLVLPKAYNKDCGDGKDIAMLPGDRIYAKTCEIRVPNYQKVEYKPKHSDFLQFPAKEVSMLQDSKGIDYVEGRHFKIDSDGNIEWIDGQKNPGIDPETGKGRLYGIRYTYIAFWYISQLINEVRMTNTSDATAPVRLPYHVQIQREYVYHNRVKPAPENKNTETPRTQEQPVESLEPNQYEVKVDMKDFGD
jgi:hypothetical protein